MSIIIKRMETEEEIRGKAGYCQQGIPGEDDTGKV